MADNWSCLNILHTTCKCDNCNSHTCEQCNIDENCKCRQIHVWCLPCAVRIYHCFSCGERLCESVGKTKCEKCREYFCHDCEDYKMDKCYECKKNKFN
jgi:hypothetical protein